MSGNEGKTQPLAPVFVDCSFDGSGKARLKIPLPQVAGAICEWHVNLAIPRASFAFSRCGAGKGGTGHAPVALLHQETDPMNIYEPLVDDFFPFSRRFCFLQIPNCSFLQVIIFLFFLEASVGAYADNDDIVPKLRALMLGGLLVKGVLSFIGVTDISCWWTPLGFDENAGTPQNLKPNKKSHRSHWVIIELFERYLGRKIREIVPLVSWRNQPQPTTIQIDRRCADRLLETSEVSLGSQIDGSFYPLKNVGIPQNSKTPKICGIPASPKLEIKDAEPLQNFHIWLLGWGELQVSCRSPWPISHGRESEK